MHVFQPLCRRLNLISLPVTATMSYGGEGRQPWRRGGHGGRGRGRRYGHNSREGQEGDDDGREGGGWHRGGGGYHRGGHRGRRWEGEDRDGGHRGQERRGRGGRGRPPPGLSGREIGMFYRQKSLANAAKREKEMTPVVNLQGNMKHKIQNLLDDINTADNVKSQPSRSGASLDQDLSEPIGRPSTSHDVGRNRQTFQRPNTAAGFSGSQRSSGARSHSSEKYSNSKVKLDNDGQRTVSSYDPWSDTDSDKMETGAMGGNSSREINEEDLCEEMEEDYNEFDELPMDVEVMQNQKEARSYIFEDEMDQGLTGLGSDPVLDKFLMKEADERKTNRHFIKMMDFRKKLPSYNKREAILEALETHQCLVISGETGCGKTTQVPQFILDDCVSRGKGSQCKVICTQPRRISAISVAERVADERGQGLDGGDIGYSIRLERKLPRNQGSVLFCTTGILLKYLESDPCLNRVSHIVVDEIHERDLLSDFLLIILKDLLPKRPNLKVILMSATLNAEQFSSYFNDCPMLHIPGFTYPVKEFWLEDAIQMTGYVLDESAKRKKPRFYNRKQAQQSQYELDERADWVKTLDTTKYSSSTKRTLLNMDTKEVDIDLIHNIIHHICFEMDGDGAILVFVPGMTEIKDLNKSLVSTTTFNNRNFRIIPLHSLMPTVNQREVFDRPPPGVRKIIIATNIAETSITIDDVVYVVDAGKIKIKDFEPESNLATLTSQWVSKANARQRRGRAGRVQEGVCFHLYTSQQQESLIDYQLPEILRTPLEELCLQIKLLKLGMVEPFINKAMQQPSSQAVHSALTTLRDLKAIDEDENLLPLGHHLARLPVDPKSGKMILFGAMFGCLDPICTIAASLSFKNAFVVPLGKEAQVDEVRSRLAEDSNSDHIMLVNAFKGWERAKRRGTASQYCYQHFLSPSILQQLAEMKGQFAKLLHDRKFIDTWNASDPSVNINSNNENLVKAIICAGLYPNVAKLKSSGRKPKHYKPMKLHLKGREFVYLHPSSVNKRNNDLNSAWFIYHKKMKTEQVYLYDTSVVSPYSLLMFGGEIEASEEMVDDELRPKVTVDEWILFWTSLSTAQMVKDLRQQLDKILEEKIKHPGPTDWSKSSREGAIMSAITELLTTEILVNYKGENIQTQRKEKYHGFKW